MDQKFRLSSKHSTDINPSLNFNKNDVGVRSEIKEPDNKSEAYLDKFLVKEDQPKELLSKKENQSFGRSTVYSSKKNYRDTTETNKNTKPDY